jgi:hypothetical protein
MITGESGTGKELVSRALHDYGRRRGGPFIAINMAAIPRELIESELFGHERGAFTGALNRGIGRFEQAAGGTLFLDEIGDMPPEAQTRLLRVLQEGEFTTVGGRNPIKANVRIVAATHRDLRQSIRQGLFREDLFYRLNVFSITVPPLKDRKDDIPALARYALARFEFRGRGFITALVLGALLIPPPLLLAPGYQLLHGLGMLDTLTGLIIPAIAPAFGVFLFRQSVLSTVPTELIEAARIDGCSEFRTFTTVVLPLVRPMIGTFLMITFLGVWNNFITPQVVLQSPERFPLSVAVAQLRGIYYQEYGLQMAGTVVAILPVMLMFLLMQREFVSGLTSGAVKG